MAEAIVGGCRRVERKGGRENESEREKERDRYRYCVGRRNRVYAGRSTARNSGESGRWVGKLGSL